MNIKNSKGHSVSYERLEFLGDAVLSAIIASHLYQEVPEGDEGYLTKMRAKIVSRKYLNTVAKKLNLIDLIATRVPPSQFGDDVHGNLFEALVGAIFLDRGYRYCEAFIQKQVLAPYIDIGTLEDKVISYKSLLIEWCQKERKSFEYDTYEDTGNDPVCHFSVKLSVDGKVVAKARDTSKKKAEEKASKRAFFVFQKKMIKKEFVKNRTKRTE